MLTGKSIEQALADAGITKIEIIPWELDHGELGIVIRWACGQGSAFPVEAVGDISNRLRSWAEEHDYDPRDNEQFGVGA